MKLKAIFLALAVAGAGASYALADDGHTSGSTTSTAATGSKTTTTQDCRRFHLRGTLVSVGASSFTINALKDAAAGAAGSPVVIAFNADTRVVWSGRGLLSGPNPGDYSWVNGKQCGGDSGALTARSALFTTPKHHGDAHTK
jgi:hypothetical protein